jgi:hypothetical protein
LSADRSAADSRPGRSSWALRSAVDLLRIATNPTVPVSAATNLDRQPWDRNLYSCRPARGVAAANAGEKIEADLATAGPTETRRLHGGPS